MSTSVKNIHSDMRGAPTVNGQVGTLIPAFDTMFITGCGVATAVSVSVAGGVATATMPSGQTFDRDAVVLVEGATPPELNGEARVLSSGSTQITFATAAADGAATGTITIKYAPQTSWVKAFAATNKAAYKSNHVQASGHYLRIDDTGTINARVRGFETMSDVDAGTGPFPTDAQMSGGGYWWKSTVATVAATKWEIFCDERFVLFCNAAGFSQNATYLAAPARGFGDPLHAAPGGDVWGTVLSVMGSNANAGDVAAFDSATTSGSLGLCATPRNFSGLGGAEVSESIPLSGTINARSGSDPWFGPIPSAIDGKLRPTRVFLRPGGSGSPIRAICPGIYYLPHTDAATVLNWGDVLTGAGELAGRRLKVITSRSGTFNGAPTGAYLVDITGPWR